MAKVRDVTNYLIHLSHSVGEPEPINPLKIQKLLYYAQGLSLAKRNQPLFTDKIKAWVEGPVVPVIWHELKQHGRSPLAGADAPVELSIDERIFLRQVWTLYGKFTGDELSRRTHNEAPWLEARGDLPPDAKSDKEITTEALQSCFQTQNIQLP